MAIASGLKKVGASIGIFEKNITLDRAMYGSDQAASIEVLGFYHLLSYIRTVESALGDGKKIVTPEEEEIKKKLRKICTL